jgi:3-phytase
MKSASIWRDLVVVCSVLHGLVWSSAAELQVDLPVSAKTSTVESDTTAVYYSSRPLLLGNDGSAATGGFHAWSLDSASPLNETVAKVTGRTKLVALVYDVGQKDLIVTIAQPDSLLRVFDASSMREIKGAETRALGDWSALCTWRSADSGNQYFYLFGKKQAAQYLIRKMRADYEIVKVVFYV